jgi:hypothetical protein
MNSLNKTARMIGVLLLVLVFIAPFSMLYVPSTLVVPGDPAATSNNVVASEGLLRGAIVSDSLVFLIEIVITVLIYVLLEPVDKTLSLVAAFARLSMTIIQGLNVLNYLFILLLLGGGGAMAAFGQEQISSLVLFLFNAHAEVTFVWGLTFALHLLVIGYLIFRSGYIAKFVGVLLLVASLCYFVQGFGHILLPQLGQVWSNIGLLSVVEIVFPIWLLVKGVKQQA